MSICQQRQVIFVLQNVASSRQNQKQLKIIEKHYCRWEVVICFTITLDVKIIFIKGRWFNAATAHLCYTYFKIDNFAFENCVPP
jgi:hypothetical protein